MDIKQEMYNLLYDLNDQLRNTPMAQRGSLLEAKAQCLYALVLLEAGAKVDAGQAAKDGDALEVGRKKRNASNSTPERIKVTDSGVIDDIVNTYREDRDYLIQKFVDASAANKTLWYWTGSRTTEVR